VKETELQNHPALGKFSSDYFAHSLATMPGTSRMPISLRESLNTVKRSRPIHSLQSLQSLQFINLDL
jgi:hypothetical protein